MIFYPKNPGKGQQIDIPISTIDYLPTAMEIAGIPNDLDNIEGESLLPLLKGEDAKSIENRALYWHFPHYYYAVKPVSSIREGSWKLLEYLEDGHIELYNLSDDLEEKHNLADTEPLKTNKLLNKLRNWKTNVGAKGLRQNDNYKKQ
jgi:arylsulfatase A-like enzyme